MFEVVKRALERYTEPKQTEEFTHVIFTREEYYKNIREKADLKENIERLERDYKNKIEFYKKSADDKIREGAAFVFNTFYKANFQKGFWEVEYLTRYMVNIIPQMMLITATAKK